MSDDETVQPTNALSANCPLVTFDKEIDIANDSYMYQIFNSSGQYGYATGGYNADKLLTPFQAAYSTIDSYLSSLPDDNDPTKNSYKNVNECANLYANNITISNTFNATGNATFSNVVTFNSNVVFANNTLFNTNPTVNGSLTVTGNASVSGSLNITTFTANNITASSNLSANGVFILNQVAQSVANTYTFANTTTPANVDIFSASSYRSLEYLVQLVDSSLGLPAYHITKILVVHDNVTTYMTEYGTIFNTQNLGTFTTGINAGNLFLQLTPTTSNVVCKFVRTAFTV